MNDWNLLLQSLRRWVLGFLGFAGAAIACTFGAEPSFLKGEESSKQWRVVWEPSEIPNWQIIAGDDALEAGLPSLAKRFYRKVLQNEEVPDDLRRPVALRLASVLISEGRLDDAQEVLDLEAGLIQEAPLGLRIAFIELGRGQWGRAASQIEEVSPSQLPPSDLPWYDLLKGLLAERRGRHEEAVVAFEQARERSQGPAQRAQIETFIVRNQLLRGQVNEALVNRLSKRVKRFEGESVGYQLAREHAIALEWLGRRSEALQVIQRQLNSLPKKEHLHRDSFLLLVGLIAGPESLEGEQALQELVRNGKDTDLQRAALYLLAEKGMEGASGTSFENFLTELIEVHPTHPLLDGSLYLKAYLLSKDRRLDEARQLLDGETGLIQQFPSSSFKKKALRLLASIAWQREEPRYRTAADYLNRLRALMPEGPRRSLLSVLAADCYFLNGDYESASEAYRIALEEWPEAPSAERLLFQQILSEIKIGRLEKATAVMDQMASSLNVSVRWRSEWNLLKALKDEGEVAKALERIEYLLNLDEKENLTIQLQVRLLWLQARLWKETEQISKIPLLADALLALLANLPDATLSKEQRAEVTAHILLLKAEALIASEATLDAGMQLLESLRQRYPATETAAYAYLVESRYWASVNRLVDAQQLLVQLADSYPDSNLAPIALYEAALDADLRGLATTYQEALELLERLSTNYRESPLVFYARLKQGDILRNLNNFGAARQIYESLIQQYPDHPERAAAELYRADCLLAQVARGAASLSEAAAAFERLFDLPNLSVDLRVEAGWKWASTLVRRKAFSRAEEVYWELLSRFLKNDEYKAQLGGSGRYWMTRVSLDLAALLEQQDKESEARKVYGLIIEYGLPGEALVRAKLDSAPVSQLGPTFSE